MSGDTQPPLADPALALRLARFFRDGADPWERLEVPLPPQVFGLASQRAFSRYLEGESRVPVRTIAEVCAWLRACERLDDQSLFCEADYWQHPLTFEQVRKGDCEDHALWAWRQLRHLGFPALFVAGLWRGTPHAWVMWADPQGQHLLETTAKTGSMEHPFGHGRPDYCPALAVDESLRTWVYQGYPRFHAATRSGPVAAGFPDTEIAILAGGRSSRMGRDKARIRVRGRSLLGWVRAAAAPLGHRIRIIRRDVVPACGPLGGVLTALRQSRPGTSALLFLSCDQPAVSTALLRRVLGALGPRTRAVFAEADGRIGFPFALRVSCSAIVRSLHDQGERSLRSLADALAARRVPVPRRERRSLLNVNTPADLAEFRQAVQDLPVGVTAPAAPRA